MPNEFLLPEEIVPFLLHDDRIVRDHARRYFARTHQFGPLTADHYWAVIDRFGRTDDSLGFAADLHRLPQTPSSLKRLMEGLATEAAETFHFHYEKTVSDIDLPLLAEHRQEILSSPLLLPHVRDHLELRLKLLDESPASAWEQLMQHGRDLRHSYATGFSHARSNALIEAAARGGEEVCRLAMATLDDESAAEDWREIFAVRLLGKARHEPAIDALVNKLAIDADVLREDVNRALAGIGSPAVVDRLLRFLLGKPWHVRLYAHSTFPTIKRPESVAAILEHIRMEKEIEAGPPEDEGEPLTIALLQDLTELGSLSGLEESRRQIEAYPEDPEVLDLCQCLTATAVMHGVTLPEADEWRREIERREQAFADSRGSLAEFAGLMRENWRKTGISFPPTSDASADEFEKQAPAGQAFDTAPFDSYVVEPIRNQGPKIGRNDPCPCGSGKKYKKCCAK